MREPLVMPAKAGNQVWTPAFAGVTLLLASCATLPPVIPESASCRADYLGLDQEVARSGVRNGGAHRIDGFPYLRSDRFLASFANEVADAVVPAQAGIQKAKFDAWVERLRQLDLASRESELRNLGWAHPDEELAHLDRCGKAWAARDLADPARRAALRENVAVPDDYSTLERALGVYPLAAAFLNAGIASFDRKVTADYATPLAALTAAGPLELLKPENVPDRAPALRPDDALGIPQIDAPQWRWLAALHQPSWLLETAGEFDRIGVPMRNGKPDVNTCKPVVYFQPALTRFGGKVLVQLVYVAWFPERPKAKALDSYAGALDGIVWRVTLDEHGRPLVYDTIHACGCYHYYFPAQALKRKAQGGYWDEPVLMPQPAPAEPFAIRVESGTHYVRRLVPLADAHAPKAGSYALENYAALLSLPTGDGPTRSLFDEDGLVRGSERFERFWLWPAGIESAGAMRQWGRHATSFVGRSHFDDPGMLDRLFVGAPSGATGF